MSEIIEKQRRLHQLIVAYKSGQIKKLSELKPFREYIIVRLKGHKNMIDDVFDSFMLFIWTSKQTPRENQTNSYLKSRFINALVATGVIKDSRYKSGQEIHYTLSENIRTICIDNRFQSIETETDFSIAWSNHIKSNRTKPIDWTKQTALFS